MVPCGLRTAAVAPRGAPPARRRRRGGAPPGGPGRPLWGASGLASACLRPPCRPCRWPRPWALLGGRRSAAGRGRFGAVPGSAAGSGAAGGLRGGSGAGVAGLSGGRGGAPGGRAPGVLERPRGDSRAPRPGGGAGRMFAGPKARQPG